jgi:hypothetical protein
MEPLEPRPRTRAWAWVVTGPLGHLWGGVADWTALFARLAWGRMVERARQRRAPGGTPIARRSARDGAPDRSGD